MKYILKGQYGFGFPVITVSPKEYLNKGAEVLLKAIEPMGKTITKFTAAPLHGATSYATTGLYRTKEKAKELQLKEKAFEKHVGPALSPSNHVIAWTQGSWDPKVGQLKIAEWGPLALLGSLGMDAIGFKYIPKGVKATANGTKTVVKTVKNKLNNPVGPKFDRSKLGRMIGRGTEQRVYDGGNGYVYKVYGKNIPNSTIKDLRGMIDTYSLRNNVDINLPVSYEGYIYNNRGQYLPVFKQKKVTIPKPEDYQQAIDMMDKRRILLGYKLSSDVLHNKDYGVFDLYPGNFGIDGGLIFVVDGPTIPRVPGTGLFNENLPGISNSLRDNIKFVNEHGGKSIKYDNQLVTSGKRPFIYPWLIDKKKKGGKTHKPSQRSRPWGHRSILDNGWQSTKLLKNKKNVYGK